MGGEELHESEPLIISVAKTQKIPVYIRYSL